MSDSEVQIKVESSPSDSGAAAFKRVADEAKRAVAQVGKLAEAHDGVRKAAEAARAALEKPIGATIAKSIQDLKRAQDALRQSAATHFAAGRTLSAADASVRASALTPLLRQMESPIPSGTPLPQPDAQELAEKRKDSLLRLTGTVAGGPPPASGMSYEGIGEGGGGAVGALSAFGGKLGVATAAVGAFALAVQAAKGFQEEQTRSSESQGGRNLDIGRDLQRLGMSGDYQQRIEKGGKGSQLTYENRRDLFHAIAQKNAANRALGLPGFAPDDVKQVMDLADRSGFQGFQDFLNGPMGGMALGPGGLPRAFKASLNAQLGHGFDGSTDRSLEWAARLSPDAQRELEERRRISNVQKSVDRAMQDDATRLGAAYADRLIPTNPVTSTIDRIPLVGEAQRFAFTSLGKSQAMEADPNLQGTLSPADQLLKGILDAVSRRPPVSPISGRGGPTP